MVLEWAIRRPSGTAASIPGSSASSRPGGPRTAPGYGRWVDSLLPHCDSYIGVDLSTRCIDACNERFAGIDKATFATNDGVTLAMVADSSVDFVFCFDSFVHVEDETLASYLKELDRVLTPMVRRSSITRTWAPTDVWPIWPRHWGYCACRQSGVCDLTTWASSAIRSGAA